jgi:F-type H+-transporting ATPase subunit epsilon
VAEPILVEVVSPEAVLYSGEADMVITRTLGGGEVAFQAGHAPFLGALIENHTRVFQTDGKVQDIAVHGGFVEVSGSPTKVSILSDKAELAEDIDIERAKEALERHVHTLRDQGLESGLVEIATAGRDRNMARLRATGTSFTA